MFEIGYGTGNLLKLFLDSGAQGGGVEKGLLERDVVESVRGRATLLFGDAEDVEFPREKVDLVYAIHLIEHVRDPNLVIRKAYEALKPGGSIYLMTPNGNSSGLRLFRSHWWNLEDPTHVRFFSEESAELLLRNSGFKDVRVRIPVWDSLTLEANSLMRVLRTGSKKNGVLDSVLTKFVDAGLLPISLLSRLAWRRIAPSIEITARK